MKQTRREFVVTAVVAASGAALLGSSPSTSAAAAAAAPAHEMCEGDPYLGVVDDGPLGGRTFEQASRHAFRFRTPPGERDRFVLGLEV